MNEPLVTSYVQGPHLAMLREPRDEAWVLENIPQRQERIREIWDFVHHFCGLMRKLDTAHPITVGVALAAMLEEIAAASTRMEIAEAFAIERVAEGAPTTGYFPLADENRPEFEAWLAKRNS